ncbi:hypothetical protein [Marilutibacter alkalisoli]|uniref:Uncharacterized protein n=1 Tax=Marilutibacter alkalisoli TaxID=2591633 RepID=A0A514BUP2_9GAMM|nr:hypothetical protein [Lysobacter alkalisoli]QDH71128.1 hypothetical protein FKV23_14305 [Lysobacter alkalisoli]
MGTPVRAYWGCRDPSATPGGGSAVAAAFARTADLLERRLQRLLALTLATMEPATLARELNAI